MTRPMPRCLPAGRSLALLLACLLANTGCFTILRDIQGTRLRLARLHSPPPGTPSTYLEFKGKGKIEPRFGFVRLGYQVRQPFDMSVSVGIFDPKKLAVADGQRGCLEMDEPPSGSPLVYAVVCADYTTALSGFNVSYFHNLDGSTVFGTTVFVPGSWADLRIAGDGSNLTFSTRGQGPAPWTDIGSTAYTRDLGVLPSVGVNYLVKGGVMDFTNPALISGTNSPASPEDYAYEELMYAEEHLFFACLEIEVGDVGGALDDLGYAADHVDNANSAIDSLLAVHGVGVIDPKELKKAAKNVQKAMSKTQKAQAQLGLGKTKPAGKQINKAIKKADQAAFTFRPFENAI
jgi:hypothetical protein